MYSVSIKFQKLKQKFGRTRTVLGIRTAAKTKNQLVYFDHQNINSLCSLNHYATSSCKFFVSIKLQKHGFKPTVMLICFGLFSKIYIIQLKLSVNLFVLPNLRQFMDCMEPEMFLNKTAKISMNLLRYEPKDFTKNMLFVVYLTCRMCNIDVKKL